MKQPSTNAIELAMSAGATVAYEVGTRFRSFGGAPREEFAEVFARHGFEHVAKLLRKIDAVRALSATVSRRKAALTADAARAHQGSETVRYEVVELQAAATHQRCWGIARKVMRAGEASPEYETGARVFATTNGNVLASGPIDAPEDNRCVAIATQLADEAYALQTVVDTDDASTAITRAYALAGAIPWVVRGAYIADVADPRTQRLVALLAELRERYYDEPSRTGIRATALPIGEVGGDEALTEAVLDDFEARAKELVESMRRNAEGGAKVRESTLERHRSACAEFLRDLDGKRDRVGGFFEHLKRIAGGVETAYAGAVKAADMRVPEWMRAGSPEEVVQPAHAAAPEAPAARPTEDAPAAEPETAPPGIAKTEPESEPRPTHSAFEL